MAKVKIPWQGDSPLLTPYGTYEFKNGVSLTDLDPRVIQRLIAIYGNRIQVIEDAGRSETERAPTAKDKPAKGNKSRRA